VFFFCFRRLKINGDHGEDIIIEVPRGVSAITDEGVLLGEVNEEDDRLLVAKGGKGGSPLNKYKGQKVEGFSVSLDLKLIADVGLVG
jgi:GTPase involved in cell partitioning and DNA repair